MKNFNRLTNFLPALATAALLAGCGSSGVGDIFGSDRDTTTTNRNDPYEQRVDNVRGTVESVNTRDRTIVVDVEDTTYRSNLRNGDDEVVLEYDDRTVVEYQGKTYRPQDLEPGDRILAEVDQSELSGSRLFVEEIQVLQDVTGGGQTSGVYNDDDDDYRTADGDLRGTVRYVDTRNRILEIETTSRSFSTSTRSGVVEVQYDADTVVEFQGRRYEPENLERGDEVEIDTRTLTGGRLLAEEILVVGDSRSSR